MGVAQKQRKNQVNIALLSSYIPEWASPRTLVFMVSDKECFGDWEIVEKEEKMNVEAMIQEEVPSGIAVLLLSLLSLSLLLVLSSLFSVSCFNFFVKLKLQEDFMTE